MQTFDEAIDLDVPRERAFEVLCNHPRWNEWMPPSFRAVGTSPGPLAAGMKCKIAMTGAPFDTTIELRTVEAPRTVRWGGGVPSVLFADHAFFFDELDGGRCRVRSRETWTGLLLPVMRSRIEKAVPRVLREQLEGLQRACR